MYFDSYTVGLFICSIVKVFSQASVSLYNKTAHIVIFVHRILMLVADCVEYSTFMLQHDIWRKTQTYLLTLDKLWW